MNSPARFTRIAPLFALGLACAAAACGRGGAPPSLGPVPESALLYDDDAGGLRDSARMVIRTRAALDELWGRATAGQPSPPPAPTVDFRREMVVAVAAGRSTPSDRIVVDSVGVRPEPGANGKMRNVLAVLVRTTSGCGRFTAPAYPVQLVRVRRYEGPVVFVERREQGEGCTRE